jgi:transposase
VAPALIDHCHHQLRDVALCILKPAKPHDSNTLYLLRTIPGISEILSWVLLDEIHDIQPFPRVQDFVSDCRLVKCAREPEGKRYGTSGIKIGHAALKWAFSEAAVLFSRANPAARHTPNGRGEPCCSAPQLHGFGYLARRGNLLRPCFG